MKEKYKKARKALARAAFVHVEETEEGDCFLRQILYRQLYAVGLIKLKDGEFVYEQKEEKDD